MSRHFLLPAGTLHWVMGILVSSWISICCGTLPAALGAPGAPADGKVDDEILKVINEEARLNFLAGRTIDVNVTVPFEKMGTFLNSNQLFLSSGQVRGGILKRETYLARAPGLLKARREDVTKVFGTKLAEAEAVVQKPSYHAELFLLILTNGLVEMGASTGPSRAQLANRLQVLFDEDVKRRNAQAFKKTPPPDRDAAWLDHLVEQTQAALFKQLTPAEQKELIRIWPICFPNGEFPTPNPAKLATVVIEEVSPSGAQKNANFPPGQRPGDPITPGTLVPPAAANSAGHPQPQPGKTDDEILKIVNEETRLNHLAKRLADLNIQPPADKGPAFVVSSELWSAAVRVEQGSESREDFLAKAPGSLKSRRQDLEKLFGTKLPAAKTLMKEPANQAALFLDLLGNAVSKMNLPFDDLKARAVIGSSSGKLSMEDIQRRNAKTMHRPAPPAHDRAWLDKFVLDVEVKLFKELKPMYQTELIRIWPLVFPDGDFKVPDLKKLGGVGKN